MEPGEKYKSIVSVLKVRSNSARRAAWISVTLILVTVFSLVFFFYIYSAETSIFGIKFRDTGIYLNKNATPDAQEKESDEIKKMRLELELKKAQLASEEQKNSGFTTMISSAVARIGAVLIGLYLVQILLSLTRYHFRLADHLMLTAQSIEISENNIDKLSNVMKAVSANHIDFGREPNTPVDKIAEIVKDAIKNAKNG